MAVFVFFDVADAFFREAASRTKKAAAWAMSSDYEGGMRRLSGQKKQLLMPNDGAKQLLRFLHLNLYI